MPHHAFQHRAHAPQRQHVEQNVPQRVRLMQEHRGDEGPRFVNGGGRHEHAGVQHGIESALPHQIQHRLHDPNHNAHRHDAGGDQRVTITPAIAQGPRREQILERR